jgi:hypothetical protein
MGFGAATPPREVFLVRFGGFAAKTNQKLGFGAQPQDVASAVAERSPALDKANRIRYDIHISANFLMVSWQNGLACTSCGYQFKV